VIGWFVDFNGQNYVAWRFYDSVWWVNFGTNCGGAPLEWTKESSECGNRSAEWGNIVIFGL